MQPQKNHITVRLTPHQFCKNCEGAIYDKFCGSCGQQHIEGRLTFALFFEEFVSKFFGIDSAIFRTIKGALKPGQVCREFLSGKRKKYMRPLTFYLAFLALFLYIKSFQDYESINFSVNFSDPQTGDSFDRAIEWMKTQTKLVQMISLPIFAYLTRIFYGKFDYNYLEHLVVWLYIKGYVLFLVNVLNFVLPILMGHNEGLVELISFFLPIFYVLYAMMQTFQHMTFWGFIKAANTYFWGFVISVAIAYLGFSGIFAIVDYYFLTP